MAITHIFFHGRLMNLRLVSSFHNIFAQFFFGNQNFCVHVMASDRNLSYWFIFSFIRSLYYKRMGRENHGNVLVTKEATTKQHKLLFVSSSSLILSLLLLFVFFFFFYNGSPLRQNRRWRRGRLLLFCYCVVVVVQDENFLLPSFSSSSSSHTAPR